MVMGPTSSNLLNQATKAGEEVAGVDAPAEQPNPSAQSDSPTAFEYDEMDEGTSVEAMAKEAALEEGSVMQAVINFETKYVMPIYATFTGIGDEIMVTDAAMTKELVSLPEFPLPVYTTDALGALNYATDNPEENAQAFIDTVLMAGHVADKFRERTGKIWRIVYPSYLTMISAYTTPLSLEPFGGKASLGFSNPAGGPAIPISNIYQTKTKNEIVKFWNPVIHAPGSGQFSGTRTQYIEMVYYKQYPTAESLANSGLSFETQQLIQEHGPDNGITWNIGVNAVNSAYSTFATFQLLNTPGFGTSSPGPHTDHTFKADVPFSIDSIEGKAAINKPRYVKISPRYNYRIAAYENTTTVNDSIPETMLPNMYFFASEMKKQNFDPVIPPGTKKEDISNFYGPYLYHITLGGTLQNPFKDVQKKGKKGVKKVGEKMLTGYGVGDDDMTTEEKNSGKMGDYFTLWAKTANEADDVIKTAVGQKTKDLIITAKDVELIKEYNADSDMFPMAIEVEFSTDKSTEFAEILETSDLGTRFMLELVKRTAADQTKTYGNGGSPFVDHNTIFHKNKTPVLFDEENKLISPTVGGGTLTHMHPARYKRASFSEIIQHLGEIYGMDQNVQQTDIPGEATILGQTLGDLKPSTKFDGDSAFLNALELAASVMAFQNNVTAFVEKHERSYEQTINGELAYSETIMYRVEKSKFGNVIQNYYFANNSKIDALKFIDTQVKYGAHYTYTIYAYQLVVGTTYNYSTPQFKEIKDSEQLSNDGTKSTMIMGNYSFKSQVSYQADPMIYEVPIYQESRKLMDYPPPPPDVNIIPYRATPNQVLINLNGSTGEYRIHPVSLNAIDEVIYDSQRSAHRIPKPDALIFKGDDQPSKFEIYRLSTRPKEWADFAEARIKTIDVATEGTSYIDKDMIPNTKYYYIFRSIDSHAQPGAPTEIYEVELVVDQPSASTIIGDTSPVAVLPRIRIIGFDQKVTKANHKPVKRFMHIFPSFEQTEMKPENFTGESAYQNYTNPLGIADDAVFGDAKEGKRFKVRLTSKKTGKKLDINLSFTTTRSTDEKPEIEFAVPKKEPSQKDMADAAANEQVTAYDETEQSDLSSGIGIDSSGILPGPTGGGGGTPGDTSGGGGGGMGGYG
tara:strand:+ start:1181 stop:4585 length:3405 start_codon:yes stop_codon:yes gene_type:complete